MPDRIERELAALAVEWPPTPDIAGAVEARLEASPEPRRRRAPRLLPSRPLAWGLAALVAILAGGLAVSPDARSAILDLLGLNGEKVERREPPPHPPARPGTLGSGLRLGRATTLAAARSRAGFALVEPRSLGTPAAVWIDQPAGEDARVSFVYGRRPGIPPSPHTNAAVLLTQFPASVSAFIEKAIGNGARLTRLTLPGARVFLITGEPHGFAWQGADGAVRFEDRRLAGTTLLVERGGMLLRAEGELGRARALALARELARP
jgi:hypothetical protein